MRLAPGTVLADSDVLGGWVGVQSLAPAPPRLMLGGLSFVVLLNQQGEKKTHTYNPLQPSCSSSLVAHQSSRPHLHSSVSASASASAATRPCPPNAHGVVASVVCRLSHSWRCCCSSLSVRLRARVQLLLRRSLRGSVVLLLLLGLLLLLLLLWRMGGASLGWMQIPRLREGRTLQRAAAAAQQRKAAVPS